MLCKPLHFFLSLCLILTILLSCFPVFSVQAATGTLKENTGTRDKLCTELSKQAISYYAGKYSYDSLASLSGRSSPTDSYTATVSNPLYTALHTLMEDTHEISTIYNGYEELSLATCWLKTDAEAGSDTYLYFYTDRLRSELDSTTLNREHVWPKSKASYYQTKGGADLHHLRPSIASVNMAKNNHCFMDIDDDAYGRTTSNIEGTVVLEVLKDAGKVEVRDNVKGDIARILLYVYCRWEQPNLYSDVDSKYLPSLDSDDNANSGAKVIEDLDTLLRWCENDPVDQWEMGRNDQTENVQGNRNVFIDYPEFAWLMFGMEPPVTMETPSGEAAQGQYEIILSVNDKDLGSATLLDNVITAVPAQHALLEGYTLLSGTAEVEQEGSTFTVVPTSNCHIQIRFREKDRITLTFAGTDSITGYRGDTVTLPGPLTTPTGYSFAGWITKEVKDTTAPGTYYQAGSSYVLTEDALFYPLYSYTAATSATEGDYKKVTTAPSDWSGDYVLVYEANKYVFNGSLANPNTYNNSRSVTITDNTIAYAQAHSLRVTLTPGAEGSYSIRTASGVYIGCTGSYSGLAYSAIDQYSNYLTMNTDGAITITASNGSRLGFMTTLRRFQYFSGNSGYNSIALYRRETTVTETYYTTELPEKCNHSSAEYMEKIEPNCEAPGRQAYYYCASCSLSFTDSTFQTSVDPAALVIPATGHNYGYFNMGENHLYYCSLCDFEEVQAHSYTDGLCICGSVKTPEILIDETIEIHHSLNLASDISINYAVMSSQLSSYDSFYLQCQLPVYEGNILVGNRTVIVEPVHTSIYYYFTLTGITAVNMADEISATLIMERKGQTYTSKEDIYSVSAYAYSQLNKNTSTEQLKTLCAELLRYGSTAQVYKAYRTVSLADAAMTEAHRSYLRELQTVPFSTTNAILDDLPSPSVTWAGKVLNLESKVVIRFVINTASYAGKVEDLSLRVTYTDYTGAEKTAVLTECVPYGDSPSYYAFDFDELLAAELRSDVSVAVYKDNTRISQTMQYNAATYGSNKTGTLRTLCQALLAYSDAAAAQFS